MIRYIPERDALQIHTEGLEVMGCRFVPGITTEYPLSEVDTTGADTRLLNEALTHPGVWIK